jgi:hypothetical protein
VNQVSTGGGTADIIYKKSFSVKKKERNRNIMADVYGSVHLERCDPKHQLFSSSMLEAAGVAQ